MQTMELVSKCLGMDFIPEKTTEYFHEVNDKTDYRNLINGKRDTAQLEPYTQVFGDKHGFINNLSILDLLFNEGRYAKDYLRNHKLL
ncbi:WbqC family protein [Flavobacterium sp.]|uniref:WbqC family protein n=1 Tax=Flavobacterium sp. TaxID=239 RepID=UPI003BE44A4B